MNAERFRSVWMHPVLSRAVLWRQLPLAAFAGLSVERLDETGAAVALPAGWRTQNPFRSTYFAAQAMAAELSTGVSALHAIAESGASVASLVTSLQAKFTKKATRTTRFVFADGRELRAALRRAIESGKPEVFSARSVGTQDDGVVVAEFVIDWSFKRRGG